MTDSERTDSKSREELAEEYEEELDRTKRRYERELHSYKYELEEKDYRLKAYEEQLAKIKQPPLLYAYVVRNAGPDLEADQLVVARANELLKVTIGTMDRRKFDLGQYVWVHPQTYAVVEVGKGVHEGVIAKVVEVLDGRLIVAVEGEMEKRILKVDGRRIRGIKPGYQISVLPPTFELLEVLPNFEVKSLLLGERPNVWYSDIGGLNEAIERVRDVVVLPYKERDLFEKIRLEPPRGILLYGPPGCGKTLMVRAIANENKMTFFNVSIADILSKWVGESERIIKELFKQANERKPSIVFFDEIEALFTTRGFMDTSGVHKNIVAQILNEMDGLVHIRDVFVIGATNRPDLLDPALLRPGRFDEIIEIPRPGRLAGEQIARIYLSDDLPVNAELAKAHGGKEKAMVALRKHLLDELYGDEKWVKVKVDADALEAVKTVKRKDIVSGAIMESIVRTAKKNFVKRTLGLRKKDRKAEGITFEDLDRAIEEECKEHAITELHVFERRQREVFRSGADPMVG
jgi:proteasome-associated ATPase